MSPLYVGIDISKKKHHASFHTPSLKKSPVFSVENERQAFDLLLKRMQEHSPLDQCHVLVESTGHYGAAIIQFLQQSNVKVYRISPKKRYGTNKNDRDDARALALLLYQQIEQGVKPLEKSWHVRLLLPVPGVCILLRGLVEHRLELSREMTRRENKLIAIEDEIFPERHQILAKPYTETALALLSAFPGPQSIAEASLESLCSTRPFSYPTREALAELQQLAAATIGTKDANRQKSLLLEQKLLITELRLLQSHIALLDSEIESAMKNSREGQILLSFIGIGPTVAPRLLAHMGTIANFKKVSELRGFLGWAPYRTQTGTSYDSEALDRKSNVPMRSVLFLVVMNAVRYDPYWKELYERMIPLKCVYDPRTKKWKGKMKVVGAIAGRIIAIMFVLLKKDYRLTQRYKEGEEIPPPELYDLEKIGKTHAIPPSDQD